MKKAVTVPVTVKLRSGWKEGKENVSEVARICEESGADAITLHARTREQRYNRAADWDLIGRVAAERGVPVIGNGDILTHYEARERVTRSGVRSLMLARGALIKPWIFRELRTEKTWQPTAEERIGVLWRFVELLRDHFGADERGVKRAMRFLPWHLGFFCRYRPLPEEPFAEQAREHPLLQSRLDAGPFASPLERLLADARPEVHRDLATLLLAAADPGGGPGRGARSSRTQRRRTRPRRAGFGGDQGGRGLARQTAKRGRVAFRCVAPTSSFAMR